ncbi:hypothetical protein PsorP6_002403 [Peronosclerospora sorghi]|uniref:Uncharacterized protein n=1 Tax=Peronosclerospora sorghi TaxID=230839 RepID=A0ACC0WWW7_9STRA|nr:hypothetical protein PsorP6_002403 [Peronosclerospora sorghi]
MVTQVSLHLLFWCQLRALQESQNLGTAGQQAEANCVKARIVVTPLQVKRSYLLGVSTSKLRSIGNIENAPLRVALGDNVNVLSSYLFGIFPEVPAYLKEKSDEPFRADTGNRGGSLGLTTHRSSGRVVRLSQ